MCKRLNTSLHNVLFVTCVLLVLAGPIALWVAQSALGLRLPSWFTAEDAMYLSGSEESANVLEHTSLGGYRRGEFQHAVEVGIGNHVPFKATALLDNAAIQRASIEVANIPFGWSCYPTFYGSNYLYVPGHDALVNMPAKATPEATDGWARFARAAADFASRHPDKRFVMYLVQGGTSAVANPAVTLMSDVLDSRTPVRIFEDAAANVENLTVLSVDYNSPEDYYHDFFRNDDHWNASGALRAYSKIAGALDLPQMAEPQLRHVSRTGQLEDGDDGYRFVGAISRVGLLPVSEDAFDLDVDYSQVRVTKSDGTVGDGNDHEAFASYPDEYKAYVFHSHYYDNLTDCLTTSNGERRALLIGDSFKGAIQRLIMSQYRQVKVSSDLHHIIVPQCGLEELVASSDADDVIMVGLPSDYLTLWQQAPHYFDEP